MAPVDPTAATQPGGRPPFPALPTTSEEALLPTQREGPELPHFPGLEVLEVLGRGGMGVVFKARQTALNRLVAVKVILAGALSAPDARARFRAEAEALARLHHPGIVRIYEVGEHQGLPYITLELCAGGSLRQALRGVPLPPARAAALVEALADAVQAAHDRGVVHRDLNPNNVLLDDAGAPRVTDFGLARMVDVAGATQTGAILGTPSYMAPEQAQGQRDVDKPADVYALGAILYECLTGRPPFQAAGVAETLLQVTSESPPTPRSLNPAVPVDLETVCLKCLRKEPGRRYASARELKEDLARYREGRAVVARPVAWPEVARRWCRRHPALALALAAVAVSLAAGACVAWYLALAAAAQARRADAKAAEVEEYARALEDRGYLTDLLLAQRYGQEPLVGLFHDCLERQRPERTRGRDLRGFEWYYWRRRTFSESLLRGHAGAVWGVALSPDGKHLASSSSDGRLKVWALGTDGAPVVLRELAAGQNHIGGMPFRWEGGEGGRVAFAGDDNVLRVWNVRERRVELALKGHTQRLSRAHFSHDGARLVSSSRDNTLRVWDARTGKALQVLKGHNRTAISLAFSPDGAWIASGDHEGRMIVWAADTGRLAFAVQAHTAEVHAVCFSPDGRCLASGGGDEVIRLWHPTTGKELASLRGHRARTRALAFSPDGRTLAAGGQDRAVRVWDVPTRTEVLSLVGHTDAVQGVSFSTDGRWIASGSEDGTVRVWDVRRAVRFVPLTGHRSQVTAVAASPTSGAVASAGGDWDAATTSYARGELLFRPAAGGPALPLLQGGPGVTCVSFSPTGDLLASGGGVWDEKARRYSGGEIRLWDAATGRPRGRLLGHASTAMRLAFHPAGRLLASGGLDGSLIVWDLESGKEAFRLAGHTKQSSGLGFSGDGRWLASCDVQGIGVCVWDVEGRRLARTLPETGYNSCLALSPDGSRLLCGKYDTNSVPVWDVAAGRVVGYLHGHRAAVTDIAYAPDGRRVATASEDATVRLWDPVAGLELLHLRGHTDIVRGVCFGKGGRVLVSGGWDRTVRVWDATPLPGDLPN